MLGAVSEATAGTLDREDAAHRGRAASFAAAVVLHVLILWGLASAISFRFLEREARDVEAAIVAVAPPIVPPPPDVEATAARDVALALPRFRPRIPKGGATRTRRFGDPALAVWSYLCTRDLSLSEATERECPYFGFGQIAGQDPLNRSGDIGALLTSDMATMTLEEAGRAKRWLRPKAALPSDGARSQGSPLGLPGHDPFDFLPKSATGPK